MTAARDQHALCLACLGPEPAQAALQAPISCNQCSKLSPMVLCREAVFVQDVYGDPVQEGDTTASPQVMESPSPMLSWADQLIPLDKLEEPVAFEMEIKSGDMSEDEEDEDEDLFATPEWSPLVTN
ncbi:hypothetical protein ROHU_000851 [Labeo rohita]|uniref:Uncharacterized protein n=1 Tax=Labeo rohita TaxID=84645 RepID=A0A498M408_LABRO|nr:hypothetical protein ROHU_029692 [Labeo rohita]RXN38730.1 hypothetical protein ROHU_000851 [Labeo rohita]